tara:strand:- start:186 stop:563 length:378 start_codon:yes stop_codon:yes gene_type:complete
MKLTHSLAKTMLVTLFSLLVSFNVLANSELITKYKAIHATHMQQEVELMFDKIDEANNFTAGIAQKNGFTFNQAMEVVLVIRNNITQCWESSFLSSATPQQLKTVVNAYDTGKTQFVKKKVPPTT